MMRRSIILISVILIAFLACPVHAATVGNFTYRVLPRIIIYNATDEGHTIHLKGSDIDWNGNQTKDVMLTALIFADQNVNNTISVTLYYDDNKRVDGTIETGVPYGPYGSYREFFITLNGLGEGNTYWKSSSSYVIDYGKENFGNGSYLIGLGKTFATDNIIRDQWASRLNAYSQPYANDYYPPLIGYTYFEENNIMNTPITRVILHCDNASAEMYLIYTSEDTYYKTVSEATLNRDVIIDITKLLGQIATFVVFVTSGLYLLELLFITNLPWIFIAIEAVGIMLIFFNAQGNIFKAIVKVWKLQEDIIDWIMYVPKFVEQHWQLSIIVAVISLIGWISDKTAVITKFLGG